VFGSGIAERRRTWKETNWAFERA